MQACSHLILRQQEVTIFILFKSRKYQECPTCVLKTTNCRIQACTLSLFNFLWVTEIAKCTGLQLAVDFVLERLSLFPTSVLDVLEHDFIFVRLILDHDALDYVICQDVLLKEKRVLSTDSHIRV